MTLPVDLVLVRHGQSEGNLAKRHSEKGQHDVYHRVHKGRHNRSFRLTDRGREQALRAGVWLRDQFPDFNRYLVSDFVRALETAGLLGLLKANWYVNQYLTERDWGDMDRYAEDEREQRFAHVLAMRDAEPFYWRPPGGESLSDLRLRLDRVFDTLHREGQDGRVIMVCHGEVMWTFRFMLERMSQERYKTLHLSDAPEDRLFNCEVHHYTRRNPENPSDVRPHMQWLRRIRPALSPVVVMPWQEILRPTYSNEELLTLVGQHPQVLVA